MKLRAALQRTLEGWRQDLPRSWREALSNVELNFASRAFDPPIHPGECIIPCRKHAPTRDAPKAAHVFRAFDNIEPAGVRALILGQDPYPNRAWATGRAFEQGDLSEWPENGYRMADSLRRIVQVLVAARVRNQTYARSDRDWKRLMDDLRRGALDLQPPRELFDYLEDQGVLFLNTSLTLSLLVESNGPKLRRGHFRLWEPFVHRVLVLLAARPTGHLVFLLWGRHAWDVFEHSGARAAAESVGAWKTRIDVVRHVHPAAITSKGAAFFHPPNSFIEANERLERMEAEPVRW